MVHDIHPDVFIQTLTELWEEDRLRQKAALRRQLKDSVRRFVDEFHAGAAKGRRRPARRQPGPRTTQWARLQIHGL